MDPAAEKSTNAQEVEAVDHETGVRKGHVTTLAADDLDVGASIVQAQEDTHYTEEEKSAVLRKIDWRIIPLAAWACGLQFVDKVGLLLDISKSKPEGPRVFMVCFGEQHSQYFVNIQDSHSKHRDGQIFYFGYLAGSFVSGRGLQYFHAGKFIGCAYFIWGGTLLGCVGAQNYATLLGLRFLLGVFESSLVPGLLLITTMWYRQQEQSLRFGLWTVTNGILPVPFLIIYWGLGHVESGPLTSWRLIFLLLGLLSCITGVLLYFFMPDSPVSVKWLTEREKAIAIKRLVDDQLGVKNTHFKWEQLKETVLDYRFWMMVLQMFFSQAAGNVTTNFLGIIIKGFGYTALKAQLYTAPNFAVQAVTQMIVSAPPTLLPRFRNFKQPLVAIASVIALIGIVILYVTPAETQYQGRRLASVIIISCSGANYTVIMAVIGTNTAGFTRKQISTSTAFFLYCVVNIITPQTFLGSESPRYHTGLAFVLSFLSIYIILSFSTWLMMRLANRARDKKALTNPAYTTGEANLDEMSGLRDETDLKNKHFRYSG
ncbi:uncharacterized protein Z519_06679 [Cladophialophora bantiana CBS 173.52]|uniref:Major facilitator superfamily (MFS) profile domain-containing protein n=1 Tax=Cladophialophora bantiana (strain ATCC 10958 / CBS 173.52 / CDC B-1940 / NIH 8579) TaxID=1442370 RepID=A0A0D2HPP8_CLAB1|nr:uncharacterized protein Z519_06679 [Cladophialophora bantiana CBS 173.52]KIW92830.1 hypothetical protein Z519_06679 [Cladophialophora bantiana CBS 173.52]